MVNWIEQTGPESDVVLSSRIRLARNFENIPFPSLMNSEQAKMVIDKCNQSITEGCETNEYQLIELKDISNLQKQIYVENHLASPGLLEHSQKAALILRNDEVISIMINEEDHIRIQCIYTGLQIKKAWELANRIDDILEEKNHYAFTENLGYLTSCPTNIGTGIRASVMLHLPGLVVTENIKSFLNTVSKIGFTIRGLYGEGTEIAGNLYQLSNQITLGHSEEEIISNLTIVTKQIIKKERIARETLLDKRKKQLEDRVWRSYGILVNARIISSEEFLSLFSDVRMAMDLGIIKGIEVNTLNKLMFLVKPANLQKSAGRELGPDERDIMRAETIRKYLILK